MTPYLFDGLGLQVQVYVKRLPLIVGDNVCREQKYPFKVFAEDQRVVVTGFEAQSEHHWKVQKVAFESLEVTSQL